MSTYNIRITDNGDGTFTPTVLRAPTTAASGGTSVTIPNKENIAGTFGTVSKMVGNAIEYAKAAILNDRAAGN